jgi:hypothetical protein
LPTEAAAVSFSKLATNLGPYAKVSWVRRRVWWYSVGFSANACERTIMEISVIELVLRHAAQRGVLDADDVNAAVDRMWGARATFLEATKIPQTRPQQKESKMAEALEEFNEVSMDVVSLLTSAASSG